MTTKEQIESLKAQVEELQERVKQLEARPYCPVQYVPYYHPTPFYNPLYNIWYNNTSSSGGSVSYS